MKLPTILLLVSLAVLTNSAPVYQNVLTPEQNAEYEQKIIELLILKYNIENEEDISKLDKLEAIDYIAGIYEREVSALKEEKDIKIEDTDLDLSAYKSAMEEQLKLSGVDIDIDKAFKIVEFLALKFYGRDYQNVPTEEYYDAVKDVIVKEIELLQNNQ